MAVDPTQLQPDLSHSTVDFNNLGLSGDFYAPQAPVSAAPAVDPSLDPSLNPTQIQDQSATNQVVPDISTVGLDSPITANPGQSNSGLGSPVSGPRVGMSYGEFTTAPPAQRQYAPRAGMSYADYQNALKGIPQPQKPVTPPPSEGKQKFGNDWMGNVLNWEQQNLPGPIRGFVHSATEQVAPTVAAIGAGMAGPVGASIATDALIGTTFDELGPWGTIIGGLVGLGSAIAGGALASSGQDAAMKQIMPSQDLSAYQAQRQYENQNYPISEALGGLAPQLMFFRANPDGLKSAASLIGDVFASKGAPGRVAQAIKNNPDGLQNLLFAAFGSVPNTFREAQSQVQNGNLNPAVLAINLVGGALFSKPREFSALGGKTQEENALAGRREMMSRVSDSFRKQIQEDPANADLYNRLADLYTAYGSMTPEEDSSGVEAMIKQYQQELEQRQSGAPQAPVDTNESGAPQTPADPNAGLVQPRPGEGMTKDMLVHMVKNGHMPEAEADKLASLYQIPGWEPIAGAAYKKAITPSSQSFEQSVLDSNGQIPEAVKAMYTTMRQLRLENAKALGVSYDDVVNAERKALPGETLEDAINRIHGRPVPGGEGNPDIRNLAAQYTQSVGLPPPTESAKVKVDPDKATRIAKFYDKAKSNPNDPKVKAAYAAFNAETEAQWNAIVNAGYKLEPWTGEGQPYKNSAEMRQDVLQNHHLYYFQTKVSDAGGTPTHELMTPEQNDMFRAVHDFFGHAMAGNQFGPNGEENAWLEHSKMYSPLAQKAMTTETRAQNSWVNFGPHGEANRANPAETVYPDQKAVILPDEFLPGNSVTRLTHYSPHQLSVIDPYYQGTGVPSEELRRIGANPNPDARFASYYEEGTKPERFFTGMTKHTIEGKFHVLDLNSPEAKQLRQTSVNQYGIFDKHLFDENVMNAGYDGYKNQGVVRMFGQRPVSHINDQEIRGDYNGVQSQATSGAEQTGLGTEAEQASFAQENSQIGKVGDQGFAAKARVQSAGRGQGSTQAAQFNGATNGNGTEAGALHPSTVGAGDVHSNAGATAESNGTVADAANGTAANARTPDYRASTFAARSSEAALGGSTHDELSAQTGTSGWRATSDLADFSTRVEKAAADIGADLSEAPMFRGGIRLLPDEHQELSNFANAKKGFSNVLHTIWDRSKLFIPDDPKLVPSLAKSSKDWEILATAAKLTKGLQAKGFSVKGLLIGPLDDATRMALVIKGWKQKDFYVKALAFPGTIDFTHLSPGAIDRWRAYQAVFGDGLSVVGEARAVIIHNSRVEAGVYRDPATGLQFDPNRRNWLIDRGIIMNEGTAPFSDENLLRAALGLMPSSIKTGDFGGGLAGEARGPIDRWMGRLGRGIDNPGQNNKVYDYEFGRLNWITRMISAYDPSILPSHVQSAMWYGYQKLITERIAELKTAALASGDRKLQALADSIKGDLESKDLADTFRETYGLVQDAQPPILPFDSKILSNHQYQEQLGNLSQYVTRRFLKGTLGKPKGDREDIQTNEAGIEELLGKKQYQPLRKALADHYQEHYVAASKKTGPENLQQSLHQNLGWATEKIAQVAHRLEYPVEANQKMRTAIETIMPEEGDANKSPYGVVPKAAIEEHLPQVMSDLEDLFQIPRGFLAGKVSMEYLPKADHIAKYDWNTGEIRLNTAHLGYGQVIANTDGRALTRAISRGKLQGKSRIKFEKLLADAQSGDDISVLRYVLAHETTHLLQDNFWGNNMKLMDAKNEAQMIPLVHAVLDHMTPEYMVGLVKEGLGNELEALIWARAKSMGREDSLNSLLGGKEKARAALPKMALKDAIYNITEHQAYQYPASKGVQHSGVSLSTDEVTRRNIHEPEVAEANQRAIGQIFGTRTRQIADSLALDADARSGGRGPNPSIDPSVLDSDAARGGFSSYAKFPYRTFQSSTSGWGDSASEHPVNLDLRERTISLQSAADAIQEKMAMPNYRYDPNDQKTLDILRAKVDGFKRTIEDPDGIHASTHGGAAYKKVAQVTQPELKTATITASRLKRNENEPIKEYAARMVQTTGMYKNLDHALEILKSSQLPVVEAKLGPGRVPGFMAAGKWHPGTPAEHVANWGNKFGGVMRDALTSLDQEKQLAVEPAPEGPDGLDHQVLTRTMSEPPPATPVVSTARAGARSVVDKAGKELQPSIPTMSKDVIAMKGVGNMPSSEKLNPQTQANVTEAAHDNFETTLESQEAMKDQGIFDPAESKDVVATMAEKDIAHAQAAQAASGGAAATATAIAPRKVTGPKPPKGVAGEARREAVRMQEKANSKVVLQNFLDSLMKAHGVGDPEFSRIASVLNDVVAGTHRTWDINEWRKDPRTWSDDAINTVNAVALAYERSGKLIQNFISKLPATDGESANDRIRKAIDVTTPGEREAALKSLSPQEAAMADLLHNYWQLLGDTGRRGGVLDSYLENYLPHILRPPKGKTVFSANGTLGSDLRFAIDRIEKGDGSLVFQKVEDLERYLQNPKRANLQGWTVAKDIGDIFSAQGKAVSQSLIMKAAADRLGEVETPIGGIPLRPVATSAYLSDKPIKNDDYYREVKIGPWAKILRGGGLEPPMKVWKPLADQMERAANVYEMEGKFTGLAKKINTVNAWFKQYKFVSPVHIYSLLSNLSSIKGVTQLPAVLHGGRDIVESSNFKRHAELVAAGLPDFNGPIPDKFWVKAGGLQLAPKKLGEAEGGVPENMAGVSGILQNLPGPAGAFFRAQHDLTWRQTGYYGLVGLADKLSKEYVSDWASRNPDQPITDQMYRDADKQAVYQAKKALGYLTNLDMSKDWDLYGNTLFLANRWTMSQLRSLGDAFSIGPLKGIGILSKFGGSSAPSIESGGKFADYLQRKNAYTAQKLVWGGMARLLMTTFVTSTAISSLLNHGVPSTPFQNFQKDPARTFDIYAGRDPNTGRDNWIRTPFFLFQREMTDWAMAGVKALQEGHPLVDPNNLGFSALFAPFESFANKMDPISRLSFELSTGTELNLWMKGYSPDKMMIDNDKYITNIKQSLDMMGVPDMGSLENRLLYAFRDLSPTPGAVFPTDMTKAAADPGAVASALGFGTFNPWHGDNLKTMAMGATGTREDQGTQFVPGPDGNPVPMYQVINAANKKDALGQQILQIASTLGTSTAQEEVAKLQQIESLREQAGYTPGQLSQLLIFGASHSTGIQGLAYQNAPNTPKTTTTKVLNGVPLTASQQALFDQTSAQRQVFAIAQLVNSPEWTNMSVGDRTNESNSMIQFADKITNEQMGQVIGTKKGIPISNSQANSMIAEFGIIKKQAQADMVNSALYRSASPQVQQTMMSDRITATQNALWAKYFGAMKGASDQQILSYVDLETGLRDEVRTVLAGTQTYATSDPASQNLLMSKNLTFADNLVNQAIQGKSPKTFNSPLTQSQLYMAVRNGVILQDVAVQNLQNTQMYQDALNADAMNGTNTATSLEDKYITLAHNIALYDTRVGVNVNNAQPLAGGFDAALNTQLQADQGYHQLITQFFGPNGSQVLSQYDQQLSDLKAQYRQENNIPPNYLSKVDAEVDRWFYQQHPDYYYFVEARKNWEKYDPLGVAYKATTQSNIGYEVAVGS